MSMQDEGAIDTGESWVPPEQQVAATDESQGLNTAAPAIDESQGMETSAPNGPGNYMNPPPGNPIQRGAQAAEGAISTALGPQGPIPNTGMPATPDDPGQDRPDPNAPGQRPSNATEGPITQKIKAMISGAGAMPPDQMEELAAQQPGETPADKKVNLIHAMVQKGDKAGAEAVLQSMRVANQSQNAFALKALQGVQGKPPNIHAAIHAANLAQENMPDGSNVIFAATNGGGIVANVTMPGQTEAKSIPLTPQQFAQVVDPGKDGQFDKAFDSGVPATLERLAAATGNTGPGGAPDVSGEQKAPQAAVDKANATPSSGSRPETKDENPNNFGPSQESLDKAKKEDADKAAGVRPDMSDEDAKTQREKSSRRTEIEQNANKLFPWISQQAQRSKYIASQLDQDQKDNAALDIQNAKGAFGVKRTEVKAKGDLDKATLQTEAAKAVGAGHDKAKVDAADKYSASRVAQVAQRIQAAADHDARMHGENAMNRAARVLIAKVNDGGYNSLNDREKAVYDKFENDTVFTPQAPTPQAPTPGTPQKPATPQQPKQAGGVAPVQVSSPGDAQKLAPGTPYVTPDGRRFTR